jgi:hypothetical protein
MCVYMCVSLYVCISIDAHAGISVHACKRTYEKSGGNDIIFVSREIRSLLPTGPRRIRETTHALPTCVCMCVDMYMCCCCVARSLLPTGPRRIRETTHALPTFVCMYVCVCMYVSTVVVHALTGHIRQDTHSHTFHYNTHTYTHLRTLSLGSSSPVHSSATPDSTSSEYIYSSTCGSNSAPHNFTAHARRHARALCKSFIFLRDLWSVSVLWSFA